jgi:hypothetical protein
VKEQIVAILKVKKGVVKMGLAPARHALKLVVCRRFQIAAKPLA